jgi:hypothetical protein
MIGINFYINFIIAVLEGNVIVTIGRAACDLDTSSEFALGPRETTENLDRRTSLYKLTSSQQSGIKYTNPDVSLHPAVALCGKYLHIWLTEFVTYAYLG